MDSFWNGLSVFLFGTRARDNTTPAPPPTTAQAPASAGQPLAEAREASEQIRVSIEQPDELSGQLGASHPPYFSGGYRDAPSSDESEEASQPPGLAPFEQRVELLRQHMSSLPEYRFDEQIALEEERLVEKWEACHLKEEHWLAGDELTSLARTIVMRRWGEQGLAKLKEWWLTGGVPRPMGFWKHQEIQDGDWPEQVRAMDSSRPFFQFMQEVSAERDHLEFIANPPHLPSHLVTHPVEALAEGVPDDLHTRAYFAVRDEQWVPQGLWDHSWGAMPGMFWRHERHIREVFLEEFGSDEGIGSLAMEVSNLLPEQESFWGRRFATGWFMPPQVERYLRGADCGASPPLNHGGRGSPGAKHFPRAVQAWPARSNPIEQTPNLLFGGFQAAAPAQDSSRSPSPPYARRAPGLLFEPALGMGGNQGELVDTVHRSSYPVGVSIEDTGRGGLFIDEQRRQALAVDCVQNGSQAVTGSVPSKNQGPRRPSLFGMSFAANPRPILTGSLSPQNPDAASPLPCGRAKTSPGRTTGQGRMLTIPEETSAPGSASESVYGDENAEDPVDAIRRQMEEVKHFAQQVIDAQKALFAQLSAIQGSPVRREPRVAFSEESHQRRILGPLPSLQRVSKKAKGKMVARSSASVSSEATTDIQSARSPSPKKRALSAEPASSKPDEVAAASTFMIREDTPQITEDTPMEEPRTVLSPRAKSKQRRRKPVERPDVQPVRRSQRHIRHRGGDNAEQR